MEASGRAGGGSRRRGAPRDAGASLAGPPRDAPRRSAAAASGPGSQGGLLLGQGPGDSTDRPARPREVRVDAAPRRHRTLPAGHGRPGRGVLAHHRVASGHIVLLGQVRPTEHRGTGGRRGGEAGAKVGAGETGVAAELGSDDGGIGGEGAGGESPGESRELILSLTSALLLTK
nr:translation initiation factor IF-2-like [Aegilops tauschii subsp. strangulata]